MFNYSLLPYDDVSGNFVGGLDIVTEMHKDNELKELLPTKEDANKKLDNRIKVTAFKKIMIKVIYTSMKSCLHLIGQFS